MTEQEIDAIGLGEELPTISAPKQAAYPVIDGSGRPIRAWVIHNNLAGEWLFKVGSLQLLLAIAPEQAPSHSREEALENLKKWLRENELG